MTFLVEFEDAAHLGFRVRGPGGGEEGSRQDNAPPYVEGIFPQRVLDQRGGGVQRLGITVENGAQDLGCRTAAKRPVSREHLIKQCAETENIGPRVEGAAFNLLGGHVCGSALDCARDLKVRTCQQSRKAEVQKLRHAFAGYQHIAGFEVAVDDVAGMRFFQSAGNLDRQAQSFFHRKGTAQRAALDVLEHEIVGTDVVYLTDVWMVQSRDGTGFQFKSLRALPQALDGDKPAEPGIAGLPHVTHSTGTDEGEDFIRAHMKIPRNPIGTGTFSHGSDKISRGLRLHWRAVAAPVLEFDDERGRRAVAVDKPVFIIGRGEESDIRLAGVMVSRHHAEIVQTDAGWVLKDRDSRFGTFVNGVRISERTLGHLDRLRFGQANPELLFVCASAGGSFEGDADPVTARITQLAIGDLRQVSSLLEGLRAMGPVRVLADVLALVLDSAIDVTGAQRGFIMLAGPDGKLEFRLGRGRGGRMLEGTDFQASRTIPEQVFASGRLQIVTDMRDSNIAGMHDKTIALGIRNVLCVPLRVVRFAERDEPTTIDERRIGVLYLDSQDKGSLESPAIGAALESMATEAAVAIENTRLYREALEKARLEQQIGDVERRRREAEQATRAKSEFLATISHEIRTPLNAIIGMADVLLRTPLTDEQKKCVEVFQRNGTGLLNLINDLLDLSKAESGRVELEATDLDLCDVIERAMETVEGQAAAKGLFLRQSIAPDVPVRLIGDPNRLRQIITNLLGNSIKFTDRGGIEIRVETDPETPAPDAARYRLRLAVTDTGIGIPGDRLDAIFESFSQAERSTARRYGGTGLGLTISRKLVESMGGRIWVESAAGHGSTFFFTAQFLVQRDREQEGVKPEPVPLADPPPGLRILLADDSEDNRFLIVSYLKGTGATIDIAENGKIAVEKFRAQRYDIVLLDVEMPVMDGFEATGEIRGLERERGAAPVPILALTAHSFSDMATARVAHQFTEILTKPIRDLTLREALARHGRVAAIPSGIPVEDGMEEVVLRYVEKRRLEAPVYRRAVETGDFETIRKLAHKMKGTGAGYGFPPLTELGAGLEKAALQGDSAGAGELIERFAEYIDSIAGVSVNHPAAAAEADTSLSSMRRGGSISSGLSVK